MCAFLRALVSLHYIGTEIDEEYCQIAAERLKSEAPAPLLTAHGLHTEVSRDNG